MALSLNCIFKLASVLKANKRCSHTYTRTERPYVVETKRSCHIQKLPTPETKSPGVVEAIDWNAGANVAPKGTKDRQSRTAISAYQSDCYLTVS
jgi:hypothetical protein